MQKASDICTKVIIYSFYTLFALVPIIISNSTSELFELNKMWLTWGLTIIIATSWFTKIIVTKNYRFPKTPLDIPIALFLLSQIISTIFSLDQRVSLWGYYSRFNGGLLSFLSYILLYYAFIANIDYKRAYRMLLTSVFSGLVVALWGLPSHFGNDPTCLLFRGTYDVSCWTDAFKPTVRIFSTLGQPAWMAAYLAVLLPITMALGIKSTKSQNTNPKQIPNTKYKKTNFLGNLNLFGIWNLHFGAYFFLVALFYLDLIFTNTRAGFLAFWIANLFFWLLIFLQQFS